MGRGKIALLRPRPWREITGESRTREGIALLAALARNGWSPTATGRELEVPASTVLELVRTRGITEQYAENARRKPGRRPRGPAA